MAGCNASASSVTKTFPVSDERDGPEGQKSACHHADDGARDRRATSDVYRVDVLGDRNDAIAADEAAMLLLVMQNTL